ncbi:MAG: GntR family transcriptional regulator [Gemmatimonas sp.]|nr:GntR family transcriptional regulator [Gemmatimonas sp.]
MNTVHPTSLSSVALTLGHRAYHEVRALLMRGAFAPGEAIAVRAVSERLGIGVTPVREALQRLAAERVLESAANRRVRVPKPDRAELTALYETRLILECEAAALAARRISTSELRMAAATFRRVVSAADAGDAPACLAENMTFHFQVYGASQLPPLVRCIEQLWLQQGPLLLAATSAQPLTARSFFGSTRPAHMRLLAALRRHDVKAARRSVQEILYSGLDAVPNTEAMP